MEEIIKKETMTSIEIAEVTEKRHDSVLRDIRNLLSQGVDAHNFVETFYIDKSNRQQKCFSLTKKGCLILASGYDALLREKIINRWEELETGKTASRYISNKEDEVRAGMAWVEGMKNLFNLSNAATLNLTKKVAAPLNLPVPEEIKSEGALLSAKDLLKKYTIGMSSQAFNKLAESNGYLETIYRTDSKGKQKSFKTITKKGLEFGENRNDERNLSETQPKWYVDKFQELLIKLGLA